MILIMSLGLLAEALRGLVCPADAATQQRSISGCLDEALARSGLACKSSGARGYLGAG
jgi:hypothetical protein